MEKYYDHNRIEKKWQKRWEEQPVNRPGAKKEKFYCLDMFPYPSGKGLHVGHWRGYVLSDVLSRFKLLQGFEVLHPMGWDAFGLPAENFAIKMGVHPSISTQEAVDNMKRQLKEMGTLYDWSKEINTTDPNYYKWTQWIFVKMFKEGLAYEKEMPLNWCPKCKIVLSNEEAVGGQCERCKSPSTKKLLRQWMLRITKYADRLLDDLTLLDWPDKVIKMQSDWIGRSSGAEVDFAVKDSNVKIKIFTTRPDTLFGATFMVLSPEHTAVKSITSNEQEQFVSEYLHAAAAKSNVDRMQAKEKTGVFTGSYAVNPLSGEPVPVWISDYVLADYGTGAIMCVPAHDSRDFEFATKFNLPIIQVIAKNSETSGIISEAYEGEGVLVNSGRFNGLKSTEAVDIVADYLSDNAIGKKTINYKLRDWVFSRQRYWGEPIPIIHCEKCGAVPVPEEQLPVTLPNVSSYLPTDTGESPLAAIAEWVNTTCPVCGGAAKRETNTMPQWAGSSWYFLRYPDCDNSRELASKEALDKWLTVDYYVGGVEHAVLHLLYARFYTKFLYDIGICGFTEPFAKLFNQGMITRNGSKMDKSRGNGISPDGLVEKFGCDSLRMYELFVGPPELDSEWDDRGIEGVYRFVNKLWKLFADYKAKGIAPNREFERLRHKAVMDITNRLNSFSMNTVVSGFMEFTNKLTDLAKEYNGIDRETLEALNIMIAPLAPHLAEELWEETGHTGSVFDSRFPSYDPDKAKEDTVTIAVQINGKLRGDIQIDAGADKDAVVAAAKATLGKKLDGLEIVKEIYVPGRIVNLVVKQ